MSPLQEKRALKQHLVNIAMRIHLPCIKQSDNVLGPAASCTKCSFDNMEGSHKQHVLVADLAAFIAAMAHLLEAQGFINKGSNIAFAVGERGVKPEDVLGKDGFTIEHGNSLIELYSISIRMHPEHSVSEILARCTEEQIDAAVEKALNPGQPVSTSSYVAKPAAAEPLLG
jgi:hypothetical protein